MGVDGFGGPFLIPSETHILTFCLNGIQVIKKTEIEQALSLFITGYIWSFCVASKRYKEVEEENKRILLK
ncbi:hypothetical protein N9140_00245 [bacterium]|nr:hypothetical protein [bacterium]